MQVHIEMLKIADTKSLGRFVLPLAFIQALSYLWDVAKLFVSTGQKRNANQTLSSAHLVILQRMVMMDSVYLQI